MSGGRAEDCPCPCRLPLHRAQLCRPELTPGHVTRSQAGDMPPPGGSPGVPPVLGTAAGSGSAAAPCSLLIVFQTEILRLDSLLKRIDQWFGRLTTLSETRTLVPPGGATPSSPAVCPRATCSPGTAVRRPRLRGNLSWCVTCAEPRGVCAQVWLPSQSFRGSPVLPCVSLSCQASVPLCG